MSVPYRVTRTNHSARTLARGLGWLSIGLGVAQLVMPGKLARFLGVPGNEGLIRACGAREIATGVGLLLTDNPKPWIYGRIGGDVLDLAGLGMSIENGTEQVNAAIAAGAVAGITALDIACAKGLGSESEPVIEWDYSDRSGFSGDPQAMRGKVEAEFAAARAEPNGYSPSMLLH